MDLLHAGCGYQPVPDWLRGYREVRLDIDPECHPDIVASITDLGDIGPYDAIYCSHCLEHVYPHEVSAVLQGFHRRLRPGGFAFVFAPDLEDVRPTDEVLFVSPAGPVAGLDLLYGFRPALCMGLEYMAHHTGFTAQSLLSALGEVGFQATTYRLSNFNLLGIGIK